MKINYLILIILLNVSCGQSDKMRSIAPSPSKDPSTKPMSKVPGIEEGHLNMKRIKEILKLENNELTKKNDTILLAGKYLGDDLKNIEIEYSTFCTSKDDSIFYLAIDVFNKTDSTKNYLHARFMPFARHPVTVSDESKGTTYNDIGILEIINRDSSNRGIIIRHPKLHKGTILTSIELDTLATRNDKFSIVISSPQFIKHGRHKHKVRDMVAHTDRHDVEDPRFGP